MNIEIDGQPVEKFAVSEANDGSRLVTIHLPSKKEKTPADRLADAGERLLRAYPTMGALGSPLRALREAIDEYRSTRNGIGATTIETFGSPPDPIRIAEFLLDSLTGGALSSLICLVRDEAIPRWEAAGGLTDRVKRDNLKASLRALGEKIGD